MSTESSATAKFLHKEYEFTARRVFAPDFNARRITRASVFDGVGQEVGPDLAHQRSVGFDFRKRGELPLDAAALGFQLEIVARALEEFVHVHQLHPQFGAAQARESQQVVNKLTHLAGGGSSRKRCAVVVAGVRARLGR